MTHTRTYSGNFRPGDYVQLTGPKNRLYTIILVEGKVFHNTHGGLSHDEIIGKPEGVVVKNAAGVPYLAMRPLLSDFVMSMPRGAAIIYPKDAVQIVSTADIFPGAKVLEAGVGSGALSLWLLRMLGSSGFLHSVERREEFAHIAQINVQTFFGEHPENWTVSLSDLNDILETVEPASYDRVILDMLAPWECLDLVTKVLKPGGVFVAYVTTVTQLSRLSEALVQQQTYTPSSSSETLIRKWHVEGLAVRPDHRMVAHTGFLLSARRLAGGTVLPKVKRRPSKQDYTEEDLEIWTPGAVGQREISEKNIRRRTRQATHNLLDVESGVEKNDEIL